MPALGQRKPLPARFDAKVDRHGPMPEGFGDPCWLWTGARCSDGYGSIRAGGRQGRTLAAHRVSWELAYGPVPSGMEIDHLCRTRGCVNPRHLEAIPHGANVLRGDLAKLSFDDVTSIRERRLAGERATALAREFGISREYVWRIATCDARATA